MTTPTPPAPPRKLPRKTVIGVVALVAALVAGGVAYAIYAITARVTGTATTLTLGYEWIPGTEGTGAPAQFCAAGIPDERTLRITINNYPGSSCTFSARVRSTGAEPARLTGTALTGLPSGWSVDLLYCGEEIPASTEGAQVIFIVNVGPTSSGSGTIGGGLTLSPKSRTGGATSNVTCTRQTSP